MTDNMEPRPYKVGYRKPPKNTRFVEGRSGNPNGRPKGSKNFSSALEKELKSRITIMENGKRKTVTKREAIAKQLVNKVLSGDFKVLTAFLNEVRQIEAKPSTAELPSFIPTQADTNLMEEIIKEVREELAKEMSEKSDAPSEKGGEDEDAD